MAQVLNCVSSHGLEAVLEAVELVIESGVLSTEHVLNVLARLNAASCPRALRAPCNSKSCQWPTQAATTACLVKPWWKSPTRCDISTELKELRPHGMAGAWIN